MAVDVLKSRGVPENRILFLNLIASPEGIDNFAKKFPKLRVVTAFVDQVSTSSSFNFSELIVHRALMRRTTLCRVLEILVTDSTPCRQRVLSLQIRGYVATFH
jgi:hypothetical protein